MDRLTFTHASMIAAPTSLRRRSARVLLAVASRERVLIREDHDGPAVRRLSPPGAWLLYFTVRFDEIRDRSGLRQIEGLERISLPCQLGLDLLDSSIIMISCAEKGSRATVGPVASRICRSRW